MKKNVFLAVTLLAFIAVGAFAQQYDSESDFQVTKTATEVTITKYVGKKTAVNIPPRIQNLPVTTIGNQAFVSIATLTSVTIPEGVKTIGTFAFALTKLTSVTIPKSVTKIGDRAFNGCPLTSVTFLGTIYRSDVEKLAFGDTNDDLYNKFYWYDTNGTPGTYTKSGSTWTKTPAAVTAPPAQNESDFTVRKEGNAITITGYTGKATVVNIPATIQNTPVTKIGGGAFSGNTTITSVTIPNGVTTIGDHAFYGCTSLTNVTIPNSVTSIEGSAFYNCKLTSITLPANLPKIDEYAFSGMKITSITIPASVKSIGRSAFDGCNNLVSVTFQGTIPSSSFSESSDAFSGDLRYYFYGKDTNNNGTPGTYTKNGSTWTKK